MKQNKLVCMVGLPRSGKSTYVDKYLRNYQIVCADDIRLALGTQFDPKIENFVWGIHDTMVRAYMVRKKDICIDSTNTTENRISKFKSMAEEYNYEFSIVYVGTPIDICLERNIGKGAVPIEVMERMAEQLKDLEKSAIFKEGNIIKVEEKVWSLK